MDLSLMNRVRASWVWLMLPLVVGFPTPWLVIFTLEVCVGGETADSAIRDIAARLFSAGNNLFLLAVWSLIPFAALSIILLLQPANVTRSRIACLSIFGMLGILGLMVPIHWGVWSPLYHIHDGAGGSSTGMVIFLPLPFMCLVTMLPGLGVGWWVSKHQWFDATVPSKASSTEHSGPEARPRDLRGKATKDTGD